MKITTYEITADLGTDEDRLIATIDLDGLRIETDPATADNGRKAKAVTLSRDQYEAVSAFMSQVKGFVWK